MNDNGTNEQEGSFLSEEVARRVAACRHVLVAFSGGLDSSVLLHALAALSRQRGDLALRAAYVHHGLNVRADDWAQHCRRQCRQWRIPFAVLPVTVSGEQNGIEAAAREARYQELRAHLLPGETLLTAQHLDDQCETFLLALKRGSGPAGLAAMAAETRLGANRLLRPLLGFSRAQLEQYARRHRLDWIEDDSNQDDRFDRNFLRLHVIPTLKQRWPHFPTAVARSAQLCAEQEQLLDELLAESLRDGCDDDGALSITGLQPLSERHRFALLRRWLAERGVRMPSREQLQHLWDDVALSRRDAEPLLQLGDIRIRRFRQRLYCLPAMRSVAGYRIAWRPTQGELTLPERLGVLSLEAGGTRVRQPAADEQVSVRFGAQGKVHIVGRAGGRALKKIWQELGVAPWRRERIPLIYYNEQLIAAPGQFVTRDGHAEHDAPCWHIGWRDA